MEHKPCSEWIITTMMSARQLTGGLRGHDATRGHDTVCGGPGWAYRCYSVAAREAAAVAVEGGGGGVSAPHPPCRTKI